MLGDEKVVSYEEKKQALLAHFLPYQKQNIYCSRIVEYLHSSDATEQKIERMRNRLGKVREERAQEFTKEIKKIRFNADEQLLHDRQEAEQLLTSW